MVSEQRFVISARIIGSVVRDSPKLKVFMISVLWSDEAEVIIYRSFQDFKKFHRQLKKRFPHMNPFRKNRVIPKFNGKARRSLQQKGSRRTLQRMKFLESYCIELLKCDQIVTQSSELTQFFMPKDHDLQTDYTKNSMMILLSDGSGGEGGDHQPAGNVTHPMLTQTYRCVAAYETKDAKNRPFKVAVDEKLDVLIKDPAGWWLVENEEKRLAWFPAPYLELWEIEDDDDDAGFQLGGNLYCAVRNYSAKKDDEVSVPIGSVVEVLRKSDDGWWLIRFNGKGGYIPSMFLQPYNNPRTGLYSVQRKLHSSNLNLSATSSEPRSSPPPSITEETSPQDSAGPSREEPSVPQRLHKARSLDVLSETWTQAQQTERDASTSNGYTRRTSNTSTELSFSGFSSDSESSSLTEGAQQRDASESGHSSPDLSLSDRRSSGKSSKSSGSASGGSNTSLNAPKVPPRPKTEEILTRCTTMTKKAALATKTRLQRQPEPIHGR